MRDTHPQLGRLTVLRKDTGTREDAYTLRIDSWKTQIGDSYNWNPNQWYVFFPGVLLSGREMIAVENAGIARQFEIISDFSTITDPKVVGNFTVKIPR